MNNAEIQWTVTVDGRDVSGPMRSYLMEVEIEDMPGVTGDLARLAFDDADGQLLLPKVGSEIEVGANGYSLFRGVVDSTPWELSRGGGRVLSVVASAFDLRGKGKERQQWHLDDTTLEEALTEAAKEAGYEIRVDPTLASAFRDYWSPDNRSFVSYASMLAKEYGATFKLQGKRAVFAKRGTGVNVDGTALETIGAHVGRNVVALSINPVVSRPRHARATATWFDREIADFRRETVDLSSTDLDVTNYASGLRTNEADAKAFLESRRIEDERAGGSGTIEMNFAPNARAEGTVILSGARPGIDGTYRIESVRHQASRGEGASTTLTVAQPQGEAGKDGRRATGVGGARSTRVPVPTPAPR